MDLDLQNVQEMLLTKTFDIYIKNEMYDGVLSYYVYSKCQIGQLQHDGFPRSRATVKKVKDG